MTREEAERRRDEKAAEEPGVTWTVSETDGGWQVVRIAVAPVTGPRSTEIHAGPQPETPDSPPSPDKQIVNPNWGF